MARYFFLALIIVVSGGIALYWMIDQDAYPSDRRTVEIGRSLFTKNCISCHSLDSDGIGPPLGGITNLLSEEELIDFIRSPSAVLAAQQPRAAALQLRYKQMMPSFEWLDEASINAILSFVDVESELKHIQPFMISADTSVRGLGRRLAPIKKSALQIELENVVQIPATKGSSPDLGIVTMRPHPAGDGVLFASDQNGFIYRIKNRKAEIFLDIRAHIKDFQAGPGIATGLGSFDFHPDFLNNGLIYISHAETYKGQTADFCTSDVLKAEVQWVISEWKVDGVTDHVFKGNHRELLRLHAPTFAHGAQDLAFVPNLIKNDPDYGLLYLGYGDGGSNNIKRPELGHHLKSFLGTILRIDPSGNNSKNGRYGIPPDNPFAEDPDLSTIKEIYAYGFRNPHHIAWDRKNGNRMFVTDIGESNIEEINIVDKGGDYGWPSREGNFGITTMKDPKVVFDIGRNEMEFFKAPFAQYDHEVGQAISGGYLYEGDLAPLQNKYVFGDIVNGKLFYVNVDPLLTDSMIYELTIVEDGRETDLRKMSNTKRLHLRIAYDRFSNQMYVITKADGRIRRIAAVH